jgi:ABC-2 type transport system ATP-binding protein
VCPDGISASCRRLEWHFQLPAAQYIHMAAGVGEFAAITIALLYAARRTRRTRTRPALIYRGLAGAALVAYPLLGAAYLSDRLGGIMEAVFFTGVSVMVITQIAERAGRAARPRGGSGGSSGLMACGVTMCRSVGSPAIADQLPPTRGGTGRPEEGSAISSVQPVRGQAPAGATSITGSQPAAVIHTEDLTKVYPGADFAAVDKLNLDVQAGEIFGLLGPNGAGKTTTAGMLTTRVVPTSGRALLGGIDVAEHPALAKQLSGIVSQQNTLDRQLTVWENLYFHGRLFGMGARDSRRISDELLAQFQLSRWAKASVYALSGGMAQRLMVARAIFHRPSVLFLDEPTAGLDPQSRLALWDLLGELHRAGQTILLTTHYMEEADKLCDRVAIMDHGRILALDTPSALKQSIGADTVVTVKTAGDAGLLGALLARDVEGVTRTRQLPGGLELHLQGTDRLIPRIVQAAERGGFDLVDLSVAEPGLETVFINLTGKELREE